MDSILSKIAEYTIEPIGRLLGRQVGYVIHCKTNLQKLKDQVEQLKAAREATESKVAEAKTKGEKIQPGVQLWLTKVGEITAQADALLNDESQAKLKCLRGFCPNLTVRHQLSRKSTKLVEEAEHYGKSGLISQVACGNLRKEVWEITNRDYHAVESRMSKVKEIMDHLKDSKTERMGVCGMGGVGKTTLVKEIYKQASEDKKLYDDVIILLDVKKDPNLEAIQKKIIEKLGMKIEPDETIDGRASRLCGRIHGKKILVILDDVQETIDLEAVGLPRLPTCKVLLTCRTRRVFDEMRADKVFQLDPLDKQDTWDLFVKMAGDIINQNSGIRDVAIKVAERCGGLPLLVVTVASALKQKSKLAGWKDALRRLKGFDKEKLTEKAYLALEWSYHQLDDKELKPLFLLCGATMKQNNIYVEVLLKYGMGLGLFKNVSKVEEAHNALDSLLEKLKDSCLLLDSDVDGKVRMHDLVCHVAKRIAYRDQQVLSVEHGSEWKEWPDKDFLRKCTMIFLPSINIPTLTEIPLECPELELLFWRCTNGYSVEIPSNFFKEMQKLKVLDFSGMIIPSLAFSLQSLKNLRTLCLDDCTLGDITLIGQLSNLENLSFVYSKISKLPIEIGQLTRLRLLDLSYCSQLKVISPTVISSLVRLEDLRMRNSFNKWEVEGERSNASLSELKHLSQLSALEIQIPNADILPPNLFSHELERFNIFIGDVWVERYSWGYKSAPILNTLKLKLTKSNNELDEGLKLLLKRSEDLSLDDTEVVVINQLNTEDFEHLKHLQLQNSIGFTDIINRKVVFPNLSTLRVHACDNLRFLLSISMARSLVQLTQLKISKCELMQEIISSRRECSEANMDNIFSKLKVLKLEELPNLNRFGIGNYIEFSSLEELEIKDCDELVEFIGDKVAMSSKDTIIRHKIEQRVLEEEDNHDIKGEIVVQYFLFNEKVGFPSLERLSIRGIRKVKAIWHVQLARNSFRRLREIEVTQCNNLISFFTPSVMERLNALQTLKIRFCKSLEVVFELLGRCNNVKETHVDTSSPNHDQLKHFYCPNLDSIRIYNCDSLKNIFPASMARGLQQLTQLSVDMCFGIEEIVGEEEEEELETTPPQFVFPKVTSVTLKHLPQLRRFYPRLHTSYWPLLKQLEMVKCDEVEILAAEFSIFREIYEMNSLISPQPFFITDEDPFPNLEDLTLTANEIWNGPAQSELVFGKLKSIRFYGNCAPFSNQASVIFLERLQNLEKIEMWWSSSSSEEIFVNRGISSSRGEIRDDDDAVGSGTLPRVRILRLHHMVKLMHLGNDNSQSAAAAAGPVLFPNLEILEVSWCDGLKSVGLSSTISFRNLTTLTVAFCHGLEYLTTYSVAKSLMQLTTLEVRQCESILVIVRSNDQDDDDDAAAAIGNINEIAFSRLQHLELYNLPRLQGFCSRNCTVKFPSSTTLYVDKCPIKLKISPDGVLLIEKDPEYQDKDETVAETKDEDEDETAQRNPEILSEGPPAS